MQCTYILITFKSSCLRAIAKRNRTGLMATDESRLKVAKTGCQSNDIRPSTSLSYEKNETKQVFFKVLYVAQSDSTMFDEPTKEA